MSRASRILLLRRAQGSPESETGGTVVRSLTDEFPGLLRPDQVLDECQARLASLAGLAAENDAHRGLDPETPSPTTSEAALAAEYDVWRLRLNEAEAEAGREIDRAVEGIEREEQAYESGANSLGSHGRRFAIEHLWVGLLAVVETFALEGPIATTLQLRQGSPENYSIAAMVSVAAAFFGNEYGRAKANADFSVGSKIPPIQRDAARRLSRWYATAVLVVAGLAVLARVYSQRLATGVLDPTGLAGFILFQIAFAAFALGLGLRHGKRAREQEIAAARQNISTRRDSKTQLLQRRKTAVEDRQTRAERLAAVGATAQATYRSELVNRIAEHDHEAAVRWRARFETDGFRIGGLPGAFTSRDLPPAGNGAGHGGQADPNPPGGQSDDEDTDSTVIIDLDEEVGESTDPGDAADLFEAIIG